MPDDLSKRGPADAKRINVHEQHEVLYWCKKFGVPAVALRTAVKQVGVMAADVKKLLVPAAKKLVPAAAKKSKPKTKAKTKSK
jgi:hypothetical protein